MVDSAFADSGLGGFVRGRFGCQDSVQEECVAGLAVKILFKKNGQFSHRCAMSELGEGHRCGNCSSTGRHEDCPNFQLHHGDTASRAAKALELAKDGM